MTRRFSSADRLVAAFVVVAATLIGSRLWEATVHAQVQTYTCTGGFGAVIGPFIPLSSLKAVPKLIDPIPWNS